jgi:hypothetical protein
MTIYHNEIQDVQGEDLSILKTCGLSLCTPIHVYQHLRKRNCHQVHEVGGAMAPQNIGKYLSNYTMTTQKTAM